MKFLYAFAAAAAAVAAPAMAQPNPNADPISGTLTLSGNFSPDPRTVDVRAGGTNDASDIGGACRGFISDAPDVRLSFSAGNLPLILSVASGADTTLVVNAPDGRWYCDDDGGENGSNPMVRFNNPGSGRYEIWVGTYSSGSTQSARLHVSEVSSQ